jgi:hypothetical protein
MTIHRLLISAALLLAAALPAQAQSDWSTCADEGQFCRVNGTALVRFGVEGRYAFRVVNRRVMCDNEEFGDPAPQQAKRCQVSYNWRNDERYRRWREGGSGDDGWRLCANEGEVCRLPQGNVRVRYGNDNRYAVREARTAVNCTNEVFGDPAPNVAKQCEYQAAEERGAGNNPGGWRGSNEGNNALVWETCAAEGERCNVGRDTMLRFGRPGRYIYREVAAGPTVCSNEAFGFDPTPGEPKRCQRLRIGR